MPRYMSERPTSEIYDASCADKSTAGISSKINGSKNFPNNASSRM